MNAFALPLSVMLVLVLAELLFLRLRGAAATPWLDVIFNLNSGHILMWFFRGVEVAVYALVLHRFSLDWYAGWHPLAGWAFAFLAWDFCFYWLHRLHHRSGALWAVHEVHHQGEHFNLSLGVRNSWYSSITSIPFFVGLAVIGVPLEVFLTVSGIHYSVQLYNHNGLVGRSGVLERFMITPAHHRVHHGANPEYIDKNFGGTFVWWDKLFGTFQPEIEGVAIRYGVPGTQQSHNPFWASNLPVLRYLGRREPPLDRGGPCPAPPRLVACGGVILFGLVIYYVHRDGRWPPLDQGMFFIAIWAGTLALGGLSDGRRWGWRLWSALAVLMPALAWARLGVQDPVGLGLLGLLAAHGVCTGVRRFRSAAGRR